MLAPAPRLPETVFERAAIYVMAGAIVNCFFRPGSLRTQLARLLSPARCPEAAVRREGALLKPRAGFCQRLSEAIEANIDFRRKCPGERRAGRQGRSGKGIVSGTPGGGALLGMGVPSRAKEKSLLLSRPYIAVLPHFGACALTQ